MKQFCVPVVVVLTAVWGLAGCGEKSEPKVQITVGSAAPAVAPVTVSTNALEPRYEATLAEGIDFKRPGFPNFLTEVSGMSGYETHGRWTEGGPVAKFRFKKALPKKFTLIIVAGAFGPNSGPPVKVRLGNVEKTFVITNKDPNTYRLMFESDGIADTLEFFPPKPISPSEVLPNNGDTRKLGIGFQSLRIDG